MGDPHCGRRRGFTILPQIVGLPIARRSGASAIFRRRHWVHGSIPRGSATTCKTTSQGDLIRKTDALNNVTCYFYDALHRVTSITYSSGTGPYSSTPAKNFVYDLASVTVNGTVIPISNPEKRMVEAFTGTTMLKLSDETFSYL